MNAWIDAMTEAAGIGRRAMDFSLSDLHILVPDIGWLLVTAAVTVFCLVAAWQDVWTSQRQGRKSDGRSRQD